MKQDYDIRELNLIKSLISDKICDLCRVKMSCGLPNSYRESVEEELSMYNNLLVKTETFIEEIFREVCDQGRNKE